ncbi:hypothetical protein COBT_000554 [Conglomerata obtusa]
MNLLIKLIIKLEVFHCSRLVKNIVIDGLAEKFRNCQLKSIEEKKSCLVKNQHNDTLLFCYEPIDQTSHRCAIELVESFLNKYNEISKRNLFTIATRKPKCLYSTFDPLFFFQEVCLTYLNHDQIDLDFKSVINDPSIYVFTNNDLSNLRNISTTKQILFINNCLDDENDYGLFYKLYNKFSKYHVKDGFFYIYICLGFSSAEEKTQWNSFDFASYFLRDDIINFFVEFRAQRFQINVAQPMHYDLLKDLSIDSCYAKKSLGIFLVEINTYDDLSDKIPESSNLCSLYHDMTFYDDWVGYKTRHDISDIYENKDNVVKGRIDCTFNSFVYTIFLVTYTEELSISEDIEYPNFCEVITDVIININDNFCIVPIHYMAEQINHELSLADIYEISEFDAKLVKHLCDFDTFMERYYIAINKNFLSLSKYSISINELKQ